MSHIPYVENHVKKDIEKLINVDEIMDILRNDGELEYNSPDYSEACRSMCKIFTFIIGNKILPFVNPEKLIVKEGIYGFMEDHTWLELDGVIIDATLLQFELEAKKLCFVDSSFEEYKAVKTFTFEEWDLF